MFYGSERVGRLWSTELCDLTRNRMKPGLFWHYVRKVRNTLRPSQGQIQSNYLTKNVKYCDYTYTV